jgi:hypothetical protein
MAVVGMGDDDRRHFDVQRSHMLQNPPPRIAI